VYTRGFLRTYADYLGLNAQSMVDLYQPAARRESSPTFARRRAPRGHPRQIPLRPVLYGISSIVFIALMGFRLELVPGRPAHLRGRRQHPALWASWHADAPRQRPPADRISHRPGVASPTITLPPSRRHRNPGDRRNIGRVRTTARVYVEAAVDGKLGDRRNIARRYPAQPTIGKDSVIVRASNGSAST